MSDGFVQVTPDSTGAKIDTEELTVGANVVDRQRVQLAGAAAAEIVKVANATPGSSDYGATVRAEALGAQADAVVDTDAAGSISAKLRGVVKTTGAVGDAAVDTDASGSVSAKLRGLVKTSGATGDAAVDTDTTGSVSGKLRGLVKILASVLNTTLSALRVLATAATSGGATPFRLISAASTNATSVKGSAGQVYAVWATNVNAAARYLKFYNKASAPTVGTDTPVFVCGLPGNAAGAGGSIAIPPGIEFTTGIAIALTTGIADSSTGAVAADEIAVSIAYR